MYSIRCEKPIYDFSHLIVYRLTPLPFLQIYHPSRLSQASSYPFYLIFVLLASIILASLQPPPWLFAKFVASLISRYISTQHRQVLNRWFHLCVKREELQFLCFNNGCNIYVLMEEVKNIGKVVGCLIVFFLKEKSQSIILDLKIFVTR